MILFSCSEPEEVIMSNLRVVLFPIILTIATFLPVLSIRAMELVGLDHFAINVSDLQRSADWYQRILGFNILHKWNTTWMIGRDNVKIGLFLRPDAKPLPDTDGQLIIQHIAFLVDGDKFAAAQNDLSKAGVKIDGPEDTGIAYSMFFKDPDGHLLEITTYHALVQLDIKSIEAPSSHGP
jgi:catechol 2,3-dioxygenase-like lactoylglutathione lyase family enzyme